MRADSGKTMRKWLIPVLATSALAWAPAALALTISGKVTVSGAAFPNVLMVAPKASCTASDASGNYSLPGRGRMDRFARPLLQRLDVRRRRRCAKGCFGDVHYAGRQSERRQFHRRPGVRPARRARAAASGDGPVLPRLQPRRTARRRRGLRRHHRRRARRRCQRRRHQRSRAVPQRHLVREHAPESARST